MYKSSKEIDEEWVDSIEESLKYQSHHIRKKILGDVKKNLSELRQGDSKEKVMFP